MSMDMHSLAAMFCYDFLSTISNNNNKSNNNNNNNNNNKNNKNSNNSNNNGGSSSNNNNNNNKSGITLKLPTPLDYCEFLNEKGLNATGDDGLMLLRRF